GRRCLIDTEAHKKGRSMRNRRRRITIPLSLSYLKLLRRFFFFNNTPPTEISTLSLHDALPISASPRRLLNSPAPPVTIPWRRGVDRKSTRLNSSHRTSSYAVFCLKKKSTRSCKSPEGGS